MTIRHLRIFVEVVRCGKMSLAAQKLYVSQPTVSQAVAEIEAAYGVRLFERLSRRLYLTREGEQLMGYARRIVELFDEMEEHLTDAQHPVRLRVGATITVGASILGGLIQTLAGRRPQIDTEVLVDNTHAIETGILASTLDAGIVEGRVHSPDIVCEPIVADRLVLVCGREHRLSGREGVELDELRDEGFILREQGSGTRELFESLMRQRGYAIRCKWVCNNAEAIKSAVAQNIGVSVISMRLVEREVREGRMSCVPIRDCCLERSFCLVYHRNKYISDYLHCFLEVCRDFGRAEGACANAVERTGFLLEGASMT